jgi:hypothetical protein
MPKRLDFQFPMRAVLSVILFCGTTAEVGALCEAVTLEEAFAASRVVFVGHAISRELDEPSRTALTTFEVEEMWKGSPAKTTGIRTCAEVVRRDLGLMFVCEADSVAFQVGTRYLIFARGEPLETNQCLPTGVIERSQAALQWLANKPRIAGR